MPFLILLAVFLLFAVVVPRAVGGNRRRLLASGVPARGLVLRASSTGGTALVNGQRFQVRNVTLDVEPQGGAPYEVSLSAQFPRMCESFPGTALDLRVDPKNPQSVTIIGPAGSSAWLPSAAWLPQAGAPSPVASGCGTAFVVVVSIGLGAGALVSFLAGAGSSPKESPEPEAPTAHGGEAPEPRVTPEEPAIAPVHLECEAAVRCCKTLGHPSCSSYATMPPAACKAALKALSSAAAKAGKKCK